MVNAVCFRHYYSQYTGPTVESLLKQPAIMTSITVCMFINVSDTINRHDHPIQMLLARVDRFPKTIVDDILANQVLKMGV